MQTMQYAVHKMQIFCMRESKGSRWHWPGMKRLRPRTRTTASEPKSQSYRTDFKTTTPWASRLKPRNRGFRPRNKALSVKNQTES